MDQGLVGEKRGDRGDPGIGGDTTYGSGCDCKDDDGKDGTRGEANYGCWAATHRGNHTAPRNVIAVASGATKDHLGRSRSQFWLVEKLAVGY